MQRSLLKENNQFLLSAAPTDVPEKRAEHRKVDIDLDKS